MSKSHDHVQKIYTVANRLTMLRDLARSHSAFLEAAESSIDPHTETISSSAWDGIEDMLTTCIDDIQHAAGELAEVPDSVMRRQEVQ